MNLTDLIKVIKRSQESNFIAMAITPLQAIGIDVAVSYLRDKGISLCGYVLITAHPNTGRVLTKDNFKSDYTGIEFINLEYVFSEEQGFIRNNQIKIDGLLYTKNNGENGKIVYLVWTEIFSNLLYVLSKSKPQNNVIFIQIDDGAASYKDDFHLKLSNLQLYATNRKMIMAYMRAGYYSIFSMMMKHNLKRRQRYIQATIFKKSGINSKQRLVSNSDLISYYITAFQMRGHTNDEILKYEDSIVINTQCLAEGNITDGATDFEVYELLSNIFKDFGVSAVLKPHPREIHAEKYNKLGWELVRDSTISQESILACLNRKPKCIISIYSSTLLNAYGLFDIPAISLAKIMLKMNISIALKKELNRYIKMYKSIIYFPENEEELRMLIGKILKNRY